MPSKLLTALLATTWATSSAYALTKTAYFVNWAIYGRNHNLYDIPLDKLDLLVYAFVNVQGVSCVLSDSWADIEKPGPADCTSGGTTQPYSDSLKGNFYQIQCLKKKYPNLKVIFSVGGWTYSKNFDYILPYPTLYSTLASSCATIMNQYGFDGIDIDFEYPCKVAGSDCGDRPNAPVMSDEPTAFSNLMDAFRTAIGPNKTLAAAFNADPRKLAQNYNITRLDKVLDHYFMMTYDFSSGSWGDAYSGHNSNLGNNSADPMTSRRTWSGQTAIDAVISLGATPSKVKIGAAFYGRGFKVNVTSISKSSSTPGLYAPSLGATDIVTYTEKNVFDYKTFMNSYYNASCEYWDPVGKAHYFFNASNGVFLSYDSPTAIQEKVKFAISRNLGGIFAWDTSGDYQNQLLSAMNYVPPSPTPSPSLVVNVTPSSTPSSKVVSASSSPGSKVSPTPSASLKVLASASPQAQNNSGSASSDSSSDSKSCQYSASDMTNMWISGFGVGVAVGFAAMLIFAIIGFFIYRLKVVKPLQAELIHANCSSKANLTSSMTSLTDVTTYSVSKSASLQGHHL